MIQRVVDEQGWDGVIAGCGQAPSKPFDPEFDGRRKAFIRWWGAGQRLRRPFAEWRKQDSASAPTAHPRPACPYSRCREICYYEAICIVILSGSEESHRLGTRETVWKGWFDPLRERLDMLCISLTVRSCQALSQHFSHSLRSFVALRMTRERSG